ncbi:MAG: condensation domain-containing protein [Planctomycetaceae bacterium]
MSIIPMPLAPFEHFMLAGDSPDHPMSFFVQMKFQGRFDRPQLNAALQAALQVHPLLKSLIQGAAKDKTSRITWIESHLPTPTIDWDDDEAPLRFVAGRWMDLRSETGLRVWLRESEDATTLILQIHHCCCDGLGASSFIQTLLMAYHLLQTSGSMDELGRMFDPQLLRERDLSLTSWRRIWNTARHAFHRVSRYCKLPPIPLATPRPLPEDIFGDDPFPRFQTFAFDAADTKKFRVIAKRLGVSLNELLLRDLFLILDDWNRRHSPDHSSRTIRVCIPINQRRATDGRMPAANVVSLSFLDRVAAQLADPIRLLGNLHEQISQTLRVRSSLAFGPALKLIGMIPGRLFARMQRTNCLASAVMSNLGILCVGSRLMGRDRRMVAGGVVLESVEVVLPLHPLTHVAFVALNYGGKLSLTISHDPRWIDAAEGRDLLESFVRQLKVSLTQSKVAATEEFAARHSSESVPVSILAQPQSVGAS